MEVLQVFVSPATPFLLLLRDSELLPDQAGYSSIVVVYYGQLCCITGVQDEKQRREIGYCQGK